MMRSGSASTPNRQPSRRRKRPLPNDKLPVPTTILFSSIVCFIVIFFSLNGYLLSRIQDLEHGKSDKPVKESLLELSRQRSVEESAHDNPQSAPTGASLNTHNNNTRISGQTHGKGEFYNLRQRLELVGKVSGDHDSKEIIDMRQLTSTLPFENVDGGVWKQGWDLQPRLSVGNSIAESLGLRGNKNNDGAGSNGSDFQIFVVPHSHCDPGWLKTFDQYFQTQTKAIITSVVKSLEADPRRKFIWAEISYFSWWWEEQPEERRQAAKRLLQNKQLEFVTGGWVQPDEANSNMDALEIQMQEGIDWIAENIGPEFVPKYGWSIDPFGYSPSLPYLLKSQFNFKAILIQRVHYAVKKELAKRKHLEFYWRQTWDTSGEYDMFTHLMPFYSYDVPHTCGPDPSICCQFDFNRKPLGTSGMCPWRKNPQAITDANVRERAHTLLDQHLKKASLYRGNAVLIPLGDDFRYQTEKEATSQYTNYQRIFDYVNQNVDGVHMQFGTLSQYFEAVQGTFKPPVLKGSFFTYSDVNNDYWSGYFTSRVFDKALDRTLERVVFAAEALGASRKELQNPRRQLSLFQHHDGVTGTARTPVVKDYANRMHEAVLETQNIMVKHMMQRNQNLASLIAGGKKMQSCWQADAARSMSENMCSDGDRVFVYNPLLTATQLCGDVEVEGGKIAEVTLPCEQPGPLKGQQQSRKPRFDERTGMMLWPIKEEWNTWVVNKGGAYLFVPGESQPYDMAGVTVEQGGYIVQTPKWRRTIVERPTSNITDITVYDFIYEINLQVGNREWFVRLSADIHSNGIFHTDLNGFNFDTHHRRDDLPIQSQIFPMPAHAAIQDDHFRLTVLSEHAQGTGSLQDGSIDLFLDRRLNQDDARGLGQGVLDNVATRTRFRVVLERGSFDTSPDAEFHITPQCHEEWNQLNHPLETVGLRTKDVVQHKIDVQAVEGAVPQRNTAAARITSIRNRVNQRQNQAAQQSAALAAKNAAPEAKDQLLKNQEISPGYAAMYADLTNNATKTQGKSSVDPALGEVNQLEAQGNLNVVFQNRVKEAREARERVRQGGQTSQTGQ